MSTATITRKPKRAQMTADAARSFGRYSAQNAETVKERLACGCEPYRDVFTYARWQAIGEQVDRGQKAIRLPLIKEVQDEETGEVIKKVRGMSFVFCRHQLKSHAGNGNGKSEAQPTPEPTPKTAEAQAFTVGGFYNTHKAVDATEDLMKGWKAL